MKSFTRFLAVAIVGLSTFAGALAQEVTPAQRDEVLERVTRVLTNAAFVPGVDFSKWPDFLAAQKASIDEAKTPNEFATAVNRALQNFGASHIVFSTPEAVQQMQQGRVVGLGIAHEVTPEGIRILDVFPDSPAAKAGLGAGDVILEADGVKPEAPSALRGPEGSKVHLKLKKADGSTAEVDIIRGVFSTRQPESIKWATPEVAVIKVPSFMTYDRKRVEQLFTEASKARSIVVDLRSNGGGMVINLYHLMGLFIEPTEPIGTFITRSMVTRYVKEKEGSATDLSAIAEWSTNKVRPFSPPTGLTRFAGPVVVLVNGGSGSASEIAAAALRDVRGAYVVGSKTAGAVLASTMLAMPHGYQLQFPFQDYVTIKGVRLEGKGVAPDLETKNPRTALDADEALLGALRWIDDRNKSARAK